MNDNEMKKLDDIIKRFARENSREYLFAKCKELFKKTPTPLSKIITGSSPAGIFFVYKKSAASKERKLILLKECYVPASFQKMAEQILKQFREPDRILFSYVSLINFEMCHMTKEVLLEFTGIYRKGKRGRRKKNE